MQNTIIICMGPPSCGKTTWYEHFKKNYNGTVSWINIETIRKQLTGDDNDFSQEELVEKIAESQLKDFLSLNINVICWDNRSPTFKSRKNIIKISKKANYKIIGIYFDIAKNICKIRNSKRNEKVSDDLIDTYYNIIKENDPSYTEGFDEIIKIKE